MMLYIYFLTSYIWKKIIIILAPHILLLFRYLSVFSSQSFDSSFGDPVFQEPRLRWGDICSGPLEHAGKR